MEMGDYLSVIRRRKLLIAAMTLAGLALALFYSVAVAKPSFVSTAKVLVRPITADVTPQGVDKLVIMGTEREIATLGTSSPAKDQLKSNDTVLPPAAEGGGQRRRHHAVPRRLMQRQDEARRPDVRPGLRRRLPPVQDPGGDQVATPGAPTPTPPSRRSTPRSSRPRSAWPAPYGQPRPGRGPGHAEEPGDQGSPYRTTLADMAKLNVNDAGTVASAANRPDAPASPGSSPTPSSAPSSASSSGC